MKGIETRETPMGFMAVRVHYSADPDKDALYPDEPVRDRAKRWFDAQRALYPDPNLWEQEMEINFFVGSGSRVYPQFVHANHVRDMAHNSRKVIYRAWDFGWHTPACLFAQIDGKDRLLLLKEVVGAKQTTRDFATEVIAKTNSWFPNHAPGFEDFCDPAGQQVKSMESERNELRDTEVLSGLGIFPRYEWGWSRKDGRAIVHQLLALRSDMTPSLYIDSQGCPTTTQAFLGQYVYTVSKDGRVKEEPDDLTHPWADVMASVRYLVIGLHNRLSVARFQLGAPRQIVSETPYHGYGTPKRTR